MDEYNKWEKEYRAQDITDPKKDRRHIMDAYFAEQHDSGRWKGSTMMSQFSHIYHRISNMK